MDLDGKMKQDIIPKNTQNRRGTGGQMIPDFVWLLVMAVELILAAVNAIEGDVAFTMLYCFSAYCCLKFMEKNKEGK